MIKSALRLACTLGLVALPAPLVAQPAAPAAARLAPVLEPAIELSPFVVNSSKDTGYQATSTLAGTRLNTPVRDLGASISIYTKDLLQDVGATNTNELLIFATSTEAAGAGGNFSGATDDINAAQFNGNSPRVNPQSSSRTRGLSAPNFTRNLFLTDIATDSYNVENLTVNRGPNSILFGVGSPAGVVESTLLRPNLNQDKNRVEVRLGDNSSLRHTVDFNRVLIRKRLALRVAALQDDERFNQRPAFEKKERVYGALTFAPYAATALRLNVEAGRTRANRPLTVLPFHSIASHWMNAGRPGYDWTFHDDPARNPAAAGQIAGPIFEGELVGQNQINDQVLAVFSRPNATAPDLMFRAATRTTAGNAANAVRAGTFHPLVNRDSGNDSIRFLVTRNIGELLGTFWVDDRVLPGQLAGFARRA
jgi:outer membrane receptor protein involved in Fe transport